ncbi:hypothetical protein HPB50_012518 [Hyalomma asiaticum]|uniref:Uncharacterized protein n=1 Tax=Hyalomma asiaticum TaxID=266040 RepID=A0ACB7RIU8_HYAAI|nr:hypothetical protein HPB50_012518 [Hyalomma asiaticum]
MSCELFEKPEPIRNASSMRHVFFFLPAHQRWFVLTKHCFSPCSFLAWRPSVYRSWPSGALLNLPRYSGTVVASHTLLGLPLLRAPVFPGTRGCVRHVRT